MTPREHYDKAESYLAISEEQHDKQRAQEYIAAAQVHALLAIANIHPLRSA